MKSYIHITTSSNRLDYNLIQQTSTCSSTPCDSEGACCLESECVITTEAQCLLLGGNYLGDDTLCENCPIPSPSPPPGYPVNIILSNFTGAGGETCSIYNGTYTVHAPFINGEPSNYNYPLPPQNETVISNSVDVGYSPNWDDIYICLNVEVDFYGSSQLCQRYDIDWSSGNYAIAFGGGFPSTPWCLGDITLEFSNLPN